MAAPEVPCPIPRYRADVAAWFDRGFEARSLEVGTADAPAREQPAARNGRARPATVIIECKQSRGDFLRECGDVAHLLERLAHLERVRGQMEAQRIETSEPELRDSDGLLFPELGRFEFERSRLPAYRALLGELARVQQQLYGQTKFFWLARYRLADHLFLIAPRGMIAPNEVPAGWGLIECGSRAMRKGPGAKCGEPTDAQWNGACENGGAAPGATIDVRITKPAARLDADDRRRVRLLRNIAGCTIRALVAMESSSQVGRTDCAAGG